MGSEVDEYILISTSKLADLKKVSQSGVIPSSPDLSVDVEMEGEDVKESSSPSSSSSSPSSSPSSTPLPLPISEAVEVARSDEVGESVGAKVSKVTEKANAVASPVILDPESASPEPEADGGVDGSSPEKPNKKRKYRTLAERQKCVDEEWVKASLVSPDYVHVRA